MAISNENFYVVPCARRSPITPVELSNSKGCKPLSSLLDLATFAPSPNPFFLLEEQVLAPMCSKARPTPKARLTPKAQSVGIAKAKSIGIATRSKILMDGKVANGTYLEVYPKKGVRARWFMYVIDGKVIWDSDGKPLITKCLWCEENSTTLDKKHQKNPVPCPVEWVMAMGVKSI